MDEPRATCSNKMEQIYACIFSCECQVAVTGSLFKAAMLRMTFVKSMVQMNG